MKIVLLADTHFGYNAGVLHARELAKEEQADCEFQVMDAENPEYDDDTFDFVISRNLTWTLPDAQKAYKEWMRVLKPGKT